MTVTVEIEDENSGLLGNSSSKPLCEWRHSAVVVVASMLGTGVLGIPLALKQMGWTMGLCTIAVTLIMSMYSGILLGRLYRAGCGASSYADLTYEVFIRRFDHRWSVIAKSVVVLVAYSYLLGVACITVTAMQISLRELLWSVKLPHLVWLGVTMVFVFPFVQLQSLHDASFISSLGVWTIFAVNTIVIGNIINTMILSATGVQYAETAVVQIAGHTANPLVTAVNGATTIIFAFGGHVIFLEVISEMRKPSDFPRVVVSSQLTMVVNYLLVGVLGFLAYGSQVASPITINLPGPNQFSALANLCLLVHVLVAYCIDSYVIVVGMQSVVAKWPSAPSFLTTDKPRTSWAVLSFLVLLAAAGISIVIPDFGSLMSLYSSIGICSLSFAVPNLLWLIFNYENMKTREVVGHAFLVLFATIIGFVGLAASANTIYFHLRT